jgi:hypothetical protein
MLRCTNAQGNSPEADCLLGHMRVSKEVVSTYTEGAESLRYARMVGKKSL